MTSGLVIIQYNAASVDNMGAVGIQYSVFTAPLEAVYNLYFYDNDTVIDDYEHYFMRE